jgi:hypothetical protein
MVDLLWIYENRARVHDLGQGLQRCAACACALSASLR